MASDANSPGNPTSPSGEQIGDQASRQLILDELAKQGREDLVKKFNDLIKAGKFHQEADFLVALAANPQALQAYLTLTERPVTSLGIAEEILSEDLWRQDSAKMTRFSFPGTPQLDTSLGQAFKIIPLDQIAVKESYASFETGRSLAAIYYELAHALEDADRLAEAASAFQSAAREDPASANLKLHLAQAFEGLENYTEALRSTLEAVLQEPATAAESMPVAISWLGKLNDRGRSLADWLEGEWAKKTQNIPLLKDHLQVNQFLGTASLYRADYVRARQYFSAALHQEEDDLYTLEWLGETLLRLAQPDEASELLQRAFAQVETSADKSRCISVGLKLARAYIDLDTPGRAIELLTSCQPDKAGMAQAFVQEYHLALGQAYLRQGDADLALSKAIQSLKIQPGQIDAVALAAAANFELERFDEARKLVDEIMSVDPECPQAIWVDAQILAQSLDEEDWKVAIYRLRQYLQSRPRHAQAQRLLIELLEKDQRSSDEIVGALRASITALGHEQALDLEWKLAELLSAQESEAAAKSTLDELEAMAQRDPSQQNARWWLLKGRAEQNAGQFEAALTSYEAGLKLEADNLDLLDEKGRLLLELGRDREAASVWEQLGEQLTEHGYPRYYQAKALDQAGEGTAAYAVLQEALKLGFEGFSNLELEAYDFQASLSDKLELATTERAANFLQAGKRYHWQARYTEAIARLQRSIELDDELAEAYWYLSEDQRLLCYSAEPPFVDAERARQSLQIWDRGYALTTINEDNAWIMLSRALLSEQLARLRDFNPLLEYWKGVSLLERFLLWNSNELVLSTLSRLHRFLSNEAAALDVARQAYESYPDQRSVIDELVAILANTGQNQEALELIAKQGELRPNDWLLGVKAFVLINQADDPAKSQGILSLLDDLLLNDSQNLWLRSMRAGVHRRRKDIPAARSDYTFIWEKRQDERFNVPGNENYFAWSGLMLAVTSDPLDPANLPEVRDWYSKALPLIANPGYALGDMATCELVMNDLKGGAARLEEAIPYLYNLREVDDLLDSFDMFSEYSQDWAHGGAVRQVFDQYRPRLIARREEVAQLPHAVIELDQIIRATAPPEEEATAEEAAEVAPKEEEAKILPPYWLSRQPDEVRQWAYLAASLGQARLFKEYHYWRDALSGYIGLLVLNLDTGWPEGITNDYLVASDKSFLGLQDYCDERFRAGDLETALGGYEYLKGIFEAFTNLALATVEGDESQMETFYGLSFLDPAQHARLLTRLGYYKFLDSEIQPGRELIQQALQLYAKKGQAHPGQLVGESLSAILQDLERFWQLDGDWQAWAAEPGTPAELQVELQEARQALSAFFNQAYQLARQPIALFASPLRIWLESSLLPGVQQTAGWALQDSYLPDLRERMLSQFGVAIPIPALNELAGWSPGSFVISLNDVPTLYDQVQPGKVFCLLDKEQLSGLGVNIEELQPRAHPITGQECCWLPVEYVEKLASLSRELWLDGDQYILLCLESLVIPNLGRLFAIDEMEELLKSWSAQGKLEGLIQEVLPGKVEGVYFTRLLRTLLQARVPLTRPQAILETFADFSSDKASMEEIEARVRARLRALLPGNQPGAIRKDLPADTETSMLSYLHELNERSILAAPFGLSMDWVKSLKELGNTLDMRTCVVVENPQLRPALEYLFNLELPNWTLMTQAEVVPAVD